MKERFRLVLLRLRALGKISGEINDEILRLVCKYVCQHYVYVYDKGVHIKWQDGYGLTDDQLVFYYQLTNSPQEQFQRILGLVDERTKDHPWEACEREFYFLMRLSTIWIEIPEEWVFSYQPKSNVYKTEDVAKWSKNIEEFQYNRIHHDF